MAEEALGPLGKVVLSEGSVDPEEGAAIEQWLRDLSLGEDGIAAVHKLVEGHMVQTQPYHPMDYTVSVDAEEPDLDVVHSMALTDDCVVHFLEEDGIWVQVMPGVGVIEAEE